MYTMLEECLTCNSDCDCIECANHLTMFEGNCLVGGCPQHYYDNNGTCSACLSTCETCDNAYTCSSCPPLHELRDDLCEVSCLIQHYYDSEAKTCL